MEVPRNEGVTDPRYPRAVRRYRHRVRRAIATSIRGHFPVEGHRRGENALKTPCTFARLSGLRTALPSIPIRIHTVRRSRMSFCGAGAEGNPAGPPERSVVLNNPDAGACADAQRPKSSAATARAPPGDRSTPQRLWTIPPHNSPGRSTLPIRACGLRSYFDTIPRDLRSSMNVLVLDPKTVCVEVPSEVHQMDQIDRLAVRAWTRLVEFGRFAGRLASRITEDPAIPGWVREPAFARAVAIARRREVDVRREGNCEDTISRRADARKMGGFRARSTPPGGLVGPLEGAAPAPAGRQAACKPRSGFVFDGIRRGWRSEDSAGGRSGRTPSRCCMKCHAGGASAASTGRRCWTTMSPCDVMLRWVHAFPFRPETCCECRRNRAVWYRQPCLRTWNGGGPAWPGLAAASRGELHRGTREPA